MNTPSLAFVGPMVGCHPGKVTTQGEVLAGLFSNAGYPVISTSSKASRYARLLDVVATLLRRGSQINTSIVNVYGGPSFVVEDIASAIGRLFSHRVVLHLHGGALPEFFAKYPAWSRRVLKRANAIVTPSSYLARAVKDIGFQAEIIPNVIDLADYPYRTRSQIRAKMFWMRTFHPIWNPQMAVRVLAEVKKHAPDACLAMAGEDKGALVETKTLAKTHGLEDAIRFPGFLNAAGKAREGNEADIFINTNRIDNMPVAVLEACAMGLPVVSTAVGGIPDLLTDGQTGLLVPDDDHAAMAAAIVKLLQTPELATQLSLNGRALAEKASWPRVKEQWDGLFARLRINRN